MIKITITIAAILSLPIFASVAHAAKAKDSEINASSNFSRLQKVERYGFIHYDLALRL
jgi:hypothetical protein